MREFKLRKIALIVLVVVSIFSYGCKAFVPCIKKKPEAKNTLLLSNIESKSIDFKTLELKAKLKADFIERKAPIKISIRISNDSIIWISLNLKSGLPIAKASFTQDSIKVIDRINNKFYRGDYPKMRKFLGVNFNYDLLQSVIANELFHFSDTNKHILNKKTKETSLNNSVFISVQQSDSCLLNLTYKINKELDKIEKVNIINNSEIVDVDYSDFKAIDGKLFPYKMLISILKNGKLENLNIDITKVNLNKKQRYPFKIIKRFEEVEL